MHDGSDTNTLPTRLHTAAEQLRLAAKALAALATLVDEEDVALLPHIDRAESMAEEMMRTTGRLAGDMSLAGPWGLDILFASPGPERPVRYASPAESIELEPLTLLEPFDLPFGASPTSPTDRPWLPRVVEATPPASAASLGQRPPRVEAHSASTP